MEVRVMAQYDPQVLQKYADKMYASATLILVVAALAGAGFGALMGNSLASGLAPTPGQSTAGPTLVGLVIGLLLGVLVGIAAGFWYKLRAQLVLCQLQTEINTRRPKPMPMPRTVAPPPHVAQ